MFRLSLQDNWEELFLQVLETNGKFYIIDGQAQRQVYFFNFSPGQLAWFFFMAMIFLGSYYLINLILAVVASSYEDQRKTVENALEEEKREVLREKVGLSIYMY